jgi:hypothetical protein
LFQIKVPNTHIFQTPFLLQIASPTTKEKNRKAKERKNVNEKDKKK